MPKFCLIFFSIFIININCAISTPDSELRGYDILFEVKPQPPKPIKKPIVLHKSGLTAQPELKNKRFLQNKKHHLHNFRSTKVRRSSNKRHKIIAKNHQNIVQKREAKIAEARMKLSKITQDKRINVLQENMSMLGLNPADAVEHILKDENIVPDEAPPPSLDRGF